MRNTGELLKKNWIIVTWIMAGFILLFVYLGLYKSVNWEVLTGFATWILAGGIVIAVLQQNESQKRAKIEFTEKRIDELNTLEMKEAADIIKERRPQTIYDLEKIDRIKVITYFERMQAIGLLVMLGYADKDLAIIAHRGKFIRCWCILKSLILNERKKHGKYGEGIEYLAKEAYKYQQKYIINQDEWVKIDGVVCEIEIDE